MKYSFGLSVVGKFNWRVCAERPFRLIKMSIDWVPLIDVPMHRRLELIAAGVQMLMLLFGQIICTATFVFLLVKNPIYFICIPSFERWCKLQWYCADAKLEWAKQIIIIRHLHRHWHFIFFFRIFLQLNGNAIVRTACAAYLAFMYFDRHAGDNGGRGAG